MCVTSPTTSAANILIIKRMPRIPLTAAQCGRFFVAGLCLFWLLLVLLWLVPTQMSTLLMLIKWLWIGCFALTLGSYLLILLQRVGITLLRDPNDE